MSWTAVDRRFLGLDDVRQEKTSQMGSIKGESPSAYDVPESMQIECTDGLAKITIRFRYISNDEPKVSEILESKIILERGFHTGRLYVVTVISDPIRRGCSSSESFKAAMKFASEKLNKYSRRIRSQKPRGAWLKVLVIGHLMEELPRILPPDVLRSGSC